LTSAQSGVPAHAHANTVTNNAVTSGAGTAHQHANTVTNNAVTTDNPGNHTHYASGGAFSGSTQYTSVLNSDGALRETSGGGAHTHSVTSNVTISNANESAHTHSVTSNVAISNVNNTAADAASAHSNMQPTMTINYIILVGA
jgi:microcystin-dependent protein